MPITPKTGSLFHAESQPIEVIKVETVDEPAPGTVIVTEYEEVRVPAGGSFSEKGGKQAGLELPDPEED
jgi:hypothetical protein